MAGAMLSQARHDVQRRSRRNRLSAVAMIASSFERGAQPSNRDAFSWLPFLVLPSSGSSSRTVGLNSAVTRSTQLGNDRVGARFAAAPRRVRSTWDISESD